MFNSKMTLKFPNSINEYHNRFHSIQMPWKVMVGMFIFLPTFIFQPFTYVYGILVYLFILRRKK